MHSEIHWDEFSYPSRRMPVFARNVVATSQPLAVQAGIHMFRQGSNAVVFESGFDPVVRRSLRERGHRLGTTPMFAFGGAQLVYRLENGCYCAASDHRKDGHAAGY